MSRIGKRPIEVPNNVKIKIDSNIVNIEGPKAKYSHNVPSSIKVEFKDNLLTVTRSTDKKQDRTLHGTTRALLNNIIIGVTEGFTKELEIQGVGYKAQVQGKKLVLDLGFSHPVNYAIPEGIVIEVPKPTQIIIKGTDKQKVGQVASHIRDYRKPEPYKGKGIRYVGEYVRKKAGKTVGK